MQHFFKKVRFNQAAVAGLIMRILEQRGPVHLALDRTNWKLGKSHINILVLALVTRRFKIPLMWSHMGHGGSSSTEQRIELIDQFIAAFGVETIQSLLTDREFIGNDWFAYLAGNNIPFVGRLRKDLHIVTEDGTKSRFSSLLHKKRGGRWQGWLSGMARTPENLLRFEAKRLEKELVIGNCSPHIQVPKTPQQFQRQPL